MLIKQRYFAKLLITATAMVITMLLVGVNAFAEETKKPSTANSLKVSPVRTDLTANPGETKTVKVTITNPSSNDVVVKAIENDFVAGDEDGTPAIILEEDQYAPKHSLKRYMKPLDKIEVPAGESKTVQVTISLPANAEPGGYFGALRFAPTSPDEGGQVNMSASVASLILLRVNGDVPEKLALTDFTVQQNGKTPNFMTNGNNLATLVRFKNEGGVQLGPVGKLSVTKGDEVVYETDFNSGEQRDMILPDSARRWMVSLKNIDGFGQYTVSATFTYGSKNQTVDAEYSFWLIPVWLMVAVAGLLVVIAGVITSLVIYRRKNPRKISLGNNKRR